MSITHILAISAVAVCMAACGGSDDEVSTDVQFSRTAGVSCDRAGTLTCDKVVIQSQAEWEAYICRTTCSESERNFIPNWAATTVVGVSFDATKYWRGALTRIDRVLENSDSIEVVYRIYEPSTPITIWDGGGLQSWVAIAKTTKRVNFVGSAVSSTGPISPIP